MTSLNENLSEDDLARAICSVLIGNKRQATAWLFSDEGHLLTVGHLFQGPQAALDVVSVQFLDEEPQPARRVYYQYTQETGEDFAILHLEETPSDRKPLPVALVKSVRGEWSSAGYGKTLQDQSSGKGRFTGLFYLQNTSSDFLFKLETTITGEGGYSGSPIFSEELKAVVAMQSEATDAKVGAERNTVLAMPLYRVAEGWRRFPKLAAEVRSRSGIDKYKSPKHYLEYRILESHRILNRASEDEEGEKPDEMLQTKYAEVISNYIRIYFLLCERIGQEPRPDIVEISKSLAGENEPPKPIELKPKPGYTSLAGSRINIGVSQMFRIADLLTRPVSSIKARAFYEAITNIHKSRRTFESRKSFRLGALGSLRPVIKKSEESDSFWIPGIPDLRMSTVQPLSFIPYELSLTKQLQGLTVDTEYESGISNLKSLPSIQNSQLSGRLRIYPAGIGVISLNLALEFKEDLPIELIAQIAHNVEYLLFVGPKDRKPYSKLMLNIIDRVIDNLFLDEGYEYPERRWRPPVTIFTFPETQTLVPSEKVKELAYLMSLAPANRKALDYLERRVQESLRSPRWTADQVLAVAGEGVALLFVDAFGNRNPKQRQQNFRLWLSETHELVSAAAYAQQAFAEKINEIFEGRWLDDSWLPGKSDNTNFENLKSLLETMQHVMRGITSIGGSNGHLRRQGTGALMSFARDIWTYSNPVNRATLDNDLQYVAEWLNKASPEQGGDELKRLQGITETIRSINPPFSTKADEPGNVDAGEQQQNLEGGILSLLSELEEMMKEYEPEEFEESDQYKQMMQMLRKQLGL